jgi:hypothetical protein
MHHKTAAQPVIANEVKQSRSRIGSAPSLPYPPIRVRAARFQRVPEIR